MFAFCMARETWRRWHSIFRRWWSRTAPDTVTCDVAGLDRLFGAAAGTGLPPSRAAPSKPVCGQPSPWPPIRCRHLRRRGIYRASASFRRANEAKFLAGCRRAAAAFRGLQKPWSAGAFAVFRSWPRCRRWGLPSGWARKGYNCASWRRGEAERKLTPLKSRRGLKKSSSWNIL